MLNVEITVGLPRNKWGGPSFLSPAVVLALLLVYVGCNSNEEVSPEGFPTGSGEGLVCGEVAVVDQRRETARLTTT